MVAIGRAGRGALSGQAAANYDGNGWGAKSHWGFLARGGAGAGLWCDLSLAHGRTGRRENSGGFRKGGERRFFACGRETGPRDSVACAAGTETASERVGSNAGRFFDDEKSEAGIRSRWHFRAWEIHRRALRFGNASYYSRHGSRV